MRALLIVVAVLAAVAAGVYFLWPENPPPPPPPAPVARVEVPAPPTVPEEPRNPVPPPPPAAPEQPPLPPLKQSDPAMLESLATLLGAASLERFFNMEDVVRRIVATVDNLPREAYASRLSPLKPIPGLFATTGRDETLEVSPANAKRYADFVAFVDRIDAKQAVSLYIHYYPLFQQAYVELGYPKGYFNDRLVTVIDHLIAAPEVKGPVPLTQPHVLYEYADAEWEARSAGHKALMRVGPENAARLKAKLREIRKELVARRAAR